MAENTIKTRIQLKNDTEENWNKAVNFVPKQGELIIYNAESGQNIDSARRFPRFKVGDGVTTAPNLPFSTAQQLPHTLTFGSNQNYTFDGSRDVTVPVYLGSVF